MTDLLLVSHSDTRVRASLKMNSNEFLNSVFVRARQMCFPFFYHAGGFSGRYVVVVLCIGCSRRWCNRSCLFRGRRGGVIQPRCTPCDCDKKTQRGGGGPVQPSPDPRCTVPGAAVGTGVELCVYMQVFFVSSNYKKWKEETKRDAGRTNHLAFLILFIYFGTQRSVSSLMSW